MELPLTIAAPEYVMDETVENASDMYVSPATFLIFRFSLGCIIVAIHNKGRSLINSNQSIHTYRQQVGKIESLISSTRIPAYLQGWLSWGSTNNRHFETTFDTISSR
jgi:hypothetical protein